MIVEKKLKALVAELTRDLKTEADLNPYSRILTKLTVETMLNAELTDHPSHKKNAPKSGANHADGRKILSLFTKSMTKRKVLPADGSIRKAIYLAIKKAAKKCNMPIQNWLRALNRFIIRSGDRLSDHL